MKICPACATEYPPERSHCERDGVMLVALATGGTSRPEDLLGQTVDGRYYVEAIVGKGGMGTVYACRHVVVGKPFAMKVLRSGVEQTEGVLQRFIREAQTANSIKSRHIVEMTDFGQLPSGQFYVTMELLEGMDLGKALKQGLSRDQLFYVFAQVAEALELTHRRGVVHRDLKPDNVFLVREGDDPLFVKLLDFGIAKAMHQGPSGLTETGMVLGTPYYMSPEQARGEEVDHRTDIYSLGVIMYRAFTGKLPFIADSAIGVLTQHLTEPPAPPSRFPNVDGPTEQVILRCMEKRRDRRFQSMREVADALRAVRAGVYAAGPVSVHLPADPASQSGAHAPVAVPPQSGRYPAGGAVPSQSGAYPGAVPPQSGPYPAGGPVPSQSGAYPGAVPSQSGPYAAAPPSQSGAYPGAVPPQSGPYAAAPPSQSGAYPGAVPSQSGAYPGAAPPQSGPYAAAPPSQSGAHIAAPPQSGTFGAARAGVHPTGQVYTGTEGALAPTVPVQTGASPPSEHTAGHGLAASTAMRIAAPRKRWPLVIGALGMLAAGGALALTLASLFGRPGPDARGAADGAGAANIAAATGTGATAATAEAPSTSATAAPSTSATIAPSAAASAEPAASAIAAPSGTATGGTGSRGGKGGGKVTPGGSSTARRPPEIRSPFD